MENVLLKLQQCKTLKQQADGLSAWQLDKKVKLADEAIDLSISAMEEMAHTLMQIQAKLGEQV
ncbi:hypothetical protein C1E23_10400 [Pseudoalteromonas phenolica]|uniref:Uncharacterized protein n=1 Tax=Pseudoalteromonas phenolica TaxID=161398 RepID=A0A4Q7INQ6_9GAMM|nr:hypothetical protein [Pseudoalteromonas phenolica]RZQ53036.1 hypothetical protein C1E23_10400 [Pseudoalteromonas phenolica]